MRQDYEQKDDTEIVNKTDYHVHAQLCQVRQIKDEKSVSKL